MYWMDSLLVTPVLGINYKVNFPIAFKFKEDVINEIFKIYGENEFDIQLNKENPFAIILIKKDGFKISIDQQNTVVSYNYPILQKRMPGKLPMIESSDITTYTNLLSEARKHLKFFWAIINQREINKINRLGMMAICNIEKNAIPPGLDQLIKHINKPWSEEIETIEGSIVVNIKKSEEYYEKCHHIIKYNDKVDNKTEIESEVIFNLDYQRFFNESITIPNNKIEERTDDFISTSLAYFEKFGQGDLNYE